MKIGCTCACALVAASLGGAAFAQSDKKDTSANVIGQAQRPLPTVELPPQDWSLRVTLVFRRLLSAPEI